MAIESLQENHLILRILKLQFVLLVKFRQLKRTLELVGVTAHGKTIYIWQNTKIREVKLAKWPNKQTEFDTFDFS
jgi:hypothetical protein